MTSGARQFFFSSLFPSLYNISLHRLERVVEAGEWVGEEWIWKPRWLRPLSGDEQDMYVRLLELCRTPTIVNERDEWRWDLETSGEFSVMSCYSGLLQTNRADLVRPVYGDCWRRAVPYHINFFVWLSLKNRIATRAFLCWRRVLAPELAGCSMSDEEPETVSHLFLHCTIAGRVLEKLWYWFGVIGIRPGSFVLSTPIQCMQMSEKFNQELNLSGKIPSGLFNTMFDFRAYWQKDAASVKSLAFDGWFITLYNIELERSHLSLSEQVKQQVPNSWDPVALAEFIEKYGTHVVVGVKIGGKDVIHLKQLQKSNLQVHEVQHLLKKLADEKFSENVKPSETPGPGRVKVHESQNIRT